MAGTQPNRFFARLMADQQYEKGRELEGAGYWERSLAAYRRACELDGANVLYLVARGRVCHAHGLESEAEQCYEVALSLRPDDTVALYNQAQLLAARGRLEEARVNLDRIVAGGGDVLGERAAPVYAKLGDIALRREEYAIAEVHYRKALEVAPEHRYAAAALGALGRFAEFERPVQPDGRIDPKVAVYCYAGAMALGLPDDDGIALPVTPALGFESLEEVAATLARVVRLARRLEWQCDVVLALDPESQPLSIALAAALDARAAGPSDDVGGVQGANCLAVSATGDDPAALARRLEMVRECAASLRCYSMGLRHPIWEYATPPAVVSLPVRLEFPWNRGEASTPEHAEAFGEALTERLRQALEADDGTTETQVAWYTRHARLDDAGASPSSAARALAPASA